METQWAGHKLMLELGDRCMVFIIFFSFVDVLRFFIIIKKYPYGQRMIFFCIIIFCINKL